MPVRLGAYSILRPLGKGGMGRVFLAQHLAMQRRAAIKILPDEAASDQALRERFYREARALAAVDHPNIVRAYDVRESEGFHFLVMEYVPGRDLQALLNAKGPLPIVEAVGYIVQAAAGLGHAHASGLIHRDVKPANLLVDDAGAVKVLDLGLARFSGDRDDQLTDELDAGAIMCTPDYASPEQARGDHVDHHADVYSLGATLYALLAGSPPFEGSVTKKLVSHQASTARPLHKVRPEVPRELSDVVAQMMAKDPAKRFDSMRAVVKALGPWRAERPTVPLKSSEVTASITVASNAPPIWEAIAAEDHARSHNRARHVRARGSVAWKAVLASVIAGVLGMLGLGISWAIRHG